MTENKHKPKIRKEQKKKTIFPVTIKSCYQLDLVLCQATTRNITFSCIFLSLSIAKINIFCMPPVSVLFILFIQCDFFLSWWGLD